MQNTISFIIAPYIHLEAFEHSIQTVRKYYSDSDIFVYFDAFRDDIEPYKDICLKNNCKFFVREQEVFFISRKNTADENLPKLLEIYERYRHTCENTSSDWIIILEEDVIIKKQIDIWPKADVGTCRNYFRPGGGSIFSRKKFLDSIANVNLKDIIYKVDNAYWAADVILENIFRRNNASFEEWVELAEPGHREDTNHAIFHGYKDLHRKQI